MIIPMAEREHGESFPGYAVEGLPNTPANLRWLLEHFECEECGRCCRLHSVGVRVTRKEAKKLARRVQLSLDEYVGGAIDGKDTFIIRQPCRHLEGNRCGVHDIKPSVCRKYPFNRYEEVDKNTAWVIIIGCPGGQKLLKMLTAGKLPGLDYRPYKKSLP